MPIYAIIMNLTFYSCWLCGTFFKCRPSSACRRWQWTEFVGR